MATVRNKATALTSTVRCLKSRVEQVEKGQEKQGISKSAKLRQHGQDEHSRDGSVRPDRDCEEKD